LNGWFKVHRKLLDDVFWLSGVFDRGKAWVDLVGLANHQEGFIRVRGNRISVLRGQVGWSEVALAKRWKWSRDKLRRWLKELEENEHQIIHQKNNVTSIISIVNYEQYQGSDTAEPTAERQQNLQQKDSRQDTNKKEKKNKEGKEDKIAPDPNVRVAIDYFFEAVEVKKGFKPQIVSKDAALVKKALKNGIDHVKDQIDFFLSNGKSDEHMTLSAALSADTYNLFMAGKAGNKNDKYNWKKGGLNL
jgi:hypothetical protein